MVKCNNCNKCPSVCSKVVLRVKYSVNSTFFFEATDRHAMINLAGRLPLRLVESRLSLACDFLL